MSDVKIYFSTVGDPNKWPDHLLEFKTDEDAKKAETIFNNAFARIAALEEVVGYLLPKAEYSNDGHCPECDVYHKEHLGGCHFIKIRAVLEGEND